MATTPPPPPYTSTSSTTFTSTLTQPTPRLEPITILLLGSPSVGKSTFLARLPQLHTGPITASTPLQPTPLDSQRPFAFHVSLFRRPYPVAIYPNTSPLFIDTFPPDPSLAVLCYAIDDRTSLFNAQHYWRRQLATRYAHREHDMPVLLLGLKRDLRHAGRGEDGELVCVMPEEGVQAATQMRADRYAECSALTGELLWEAVEDITRTAALTTTEKGGLSDGGFSCVIM